MNQMFKNTSSIFLVLTVLLFSLSAGIIYNFDKIYAQSGTGAQSTTNPLNNLDPIILSLPKACTFDDSDDPIEDPDTCTPIQPNQNAGSDNSILFNLDSSEPVDTFRCELLDQNGNIAVLPAGNPANPGDCKIDSNHVQIQYTNLDDSRYTFIVRATKQEDISQTNNANAATVTVTRTGESPPFVFIIGTGAGLTGGPGFDTTNRLIPNATSFKFKDIISEGKTSLLNVLDIKPNTVIKYNTTACFQTIGHDHVSFDEIPCEDFVVFTGSQQINNTTKLNLTQANAFSLPTAINQGIEKPIHLCYMGQYSEFEGDYGAAFLKSFPCEDILIAYK
jgi:hypothetical protein